MIGSKIRELRKSRNMTQKDLAEGILHRSVLIRIESGKSIPNIEQLRKIAVKLKVPIESLITEGQVELDLKDHTNVFSDMHMLLLDKEYETIVKTYATSNKTDFKQKYGLLSNYFVGISLWFLKDYAQALKHLQVFTNRVKKLDCNSKRNYAIEYAEALNTMAKINIIEKKVDKAEPFFVLARKTLIDFGRQNHILFWSISHNLAYYYDEVMEYKKAIDLLQDIIKEENPLIHRIATPAAHQTASVIYKKMGDFASAKKQLMKAVNLYTYVGNEHRANLCKINMINMMRIEGEYGNATDFIKSQLIWLDPSKQDYHIFQLYLAFILFNSGNHAGVAQVLKGLNYGKLRIKDRYSYLFLKGYTYFHSNQPAKALTCFKRALPFLVENSYYLDAIFANNILFSITHDETYLKENARLINLPYNTNLILDPKDIS